MVTFTLVDLHDKMNSIPKLIDAILSAWTKSLEAPYGTGEYSSAKDGATDCNRFVNDVLNQFGYLKFNGLTANEMCDAFSNGDWLEIEGDTAQYHANNGIVVVAGWKNPTGDHGHVCMVRPGIAEASTSWNVSSFSVPKIANVSRPELCRIDRKASFAFSSDKIPKYFALKTMIP